MRLICTETGCKYNDEEVCKREEVTLEGVAWDIDNLFRCADYEGEVSHDNPQEL